MKPQEYIPYSPCLLLHFNLAASDIIFHRSLKFAYHIVIQDLLNFYLYTHFELSIYTNIQSRFYCLEKCFS